MLTEVSVNRQGFGLVFMLRIAVNADIGKLEWFGAFSDHRQIIAEAFSAQTRGEGLVLVASLDDFPVAQLWVRFSQTRGHLARFWAFRVMEPFRGFGVGSGLLVFGEQILLARKFRSCEIGVERSNQPVRRFYEKMGYQLAYEHVEEYSFVTPSGDFRKGIADQWILRKKLSLVEPARRLTSAALTRHEHRALFDAPANGRAGPQLPVGRNRATAGRAYSGRRSERRILRARDYEDETVSRS